MTASLRQTKRQANGGDSSSTAPFPTANGSVLHQDLLYETLVCLPVKLLCRLQAVCRSWRSLLSGSSFLASHSARHGPLVAAFTRGVSSAGIDILDTSGHTVGHICVENYRRNRLGNVACTNLDLLSFIGKDKRLYVMDPATGVVSLLPDDSGFNHKSPFTGFAIGRASLTGEAKVLVINTKGMELNPCKVLTLAGGATATASKWRKTGCAQTSLMNTSSFVALVKGVLYFTGYDQHHERHDHVAAYDLETEAWWPDLVHLPLPSKRPGGLAELSNNLVAIYDNYNDQIPDIFMDLRFL